MWTFVSGFICGAVSVVVAVLAGLFLALNSLGEMWD